MAAKMESGEEDLKAEIKTTQEKMKTRQEDLKAEMLMKIEAAQENFKTSPREEIQAC